MTATIPNRARSIIEHALRAIAWLGLLSAMYLAIQPAGLRGRPANALRWSLSALGDSSATALTTAVVREVVAAAGDTQPRRVTVELTAVPSQRARALLGAAEGAAVSFGWVDRTHVAGLALSATAVAGPSGAVDVRVSGAHPASVAIVDSIATALPLVLRDAGGTLDSLPNPRLAAWRLASVSPPLRAMLGPSVARVSTQAPVFTRRVMLIAQPGWESKFVAAALEEAGWQVDGSYRVSPRTAVTVGAPERLDTARYAVVVLLDSMAVDAASVSRFVRQGGGLVLSGDALRIPAFAAIRPVRATTVRGAVAGALLTDVPQQGLEAWELVVNRGASMVRSAPSDHGHAEAVLVAQRVGAGRVVASAYRNSWRWRMEGTDDGAAEHRRWWSDVLALAAGVPASSGDAAFDAYPGDAAPYADLVARAGMPVSDGGPAAAAPTRTLSAFEQLMDRLRKAPGLLFIVIAVALLGEWASRRLRGNR